MPRCCHACNLLSPLLAFIVCYTFVFGAGCYYIIRLIAKGPGAPDEEVYGTHGVKKPPLVTDLNYSSSAKNGCVR